MLLKQIFVYMLTDDEIVNLREIGFKVVKITKEMTGMLIKDIIDGKHEFKFKATPNEKIILLNNFTSTEISNAVAILRTVQKDGIIASVTEFSREWTLDYLVNHLIEERNYHNNQRG